MRLEWRFERELGIIFGVEFKGNEEYLVGYLQEPSRCQRLVIAFPPNSPGTEIFCVAGSCKKRVSEFIPGNMEVQSGYPAS